MIDQLIAGIITWFHIVSVYVGLGRLLLFWFQSDLRLVSFRLRQVVNLFSK